MTALSPSGSSRTEADEFLAAHPAIEAIDIVLIDANGVGRGKIIRRHELLSLYTQGRNLPLSILGLDVTGEDVEDTGLVWSVGDADRLAWPVPGTLKPMPWTSPPRAQVLLSLFELEGTPHPADPRHAMQRQIATLARKGLTPAGAFELEFFLFDAARESDGRPRPATALLDGRPARQTQVYGLDKLDGMQPLFADIYKGARDQELPVETLISEYAPGQFELTLRYRTDLARAADDLICLKRLVRGVARRHQLTACFMAKPLAGSAGSGMHAHVSLSDAQGRNAFAENRDGEVSDRLRHAIGGMLATMGDSMLVFAPHANSWRRFVARSYAPMQATWGVNNRSVAIRVPAGPAGARRFEHRVAGVDANPHLIAATLLAAVNAGLETQADPGPAVSGNGYESPPSPTPVPSRMPRDWAEAIAFARNSRFLRDALGEPLHRSFVAIKQAEYERVASTVSALDYELYLDNV